MKVTIYCSGSVRKGNDQRRKLQWGNEERQALKTGARPLCVNFIDPEDPLPDLSDSIALLGRDLYGVQHADAVVVDARERRGIGIGVEMLASRLFGTRLVAVVPHNSHYHRNELAFRGGTVKDYVHPHLVELADVVVEDFYEAGAWLARHCQQPAAVKGTDVLNAAIRAYEERLLESDPGMQPSAQRFKRAA